ncbi:hypothetical protein BH11PLA1_BH11PLA1_04400 [soil metagenome]
MKSLLKDNEAKAFDQAHSHPDAAQQGAARAAKLKKIKLGAAAGMLLLAGLIVWAPWGTPVVKAPPVVQQHADTVTQKLQELERADERMRSPTFDPNAGMGAPAASGPTSLRKRH